MQRILLSAFVVAVAMAGAAYGQQAERRFTTCSQVAAFSSQQCTGPRSGLCQNTVEQNRSGCMATGTWQRISRDGQPIGAPITNLRRE